jgi:hypothetical protein
MVDEVGLLVLDGVGMTNLLVQVVARFWWCSFRFVDVYVGGLWPIRKFDFDSRVF